MKQLSLGNESIDFQSDALFKDLILIIKDLRGSGASDEKTLAPYLVRVDRCVYDHTGVNTWTQLWVGVENAIVFTPNLTKGSVLNTVSFNKWLEKNYSADNIKFLDLKRKGWVDPKSSKVGGAFSEIVNKIYVGTGLLTNKKFTEEEVAGAIIHEVGHAYIFLQMICDSVMVNHVLQRSWQELTSKNVDVTVRVILDKAATDLEIKNKTWLEAVTDGTDKEVAFRILVSAVQIEPREMDNKRFSTQSAFEELADIFAARHGAAVAMVSLRAKLGQSKYIDSFGLVHAAFYGLSALIALPILPILGAISAFVGGGLIWNAFKMANAAPDIATFKQFATKMRNQLVEQLKQAKLPKEDIKPILDNLEAVNDMIQSDQTTPAQIPVFIRFVDMFRQGKMDARSSRDYTDKLEVLTSNLLFVHAARLRAQ